MIRYALHCDSGHAFESWFQSSDTYDRQVSRGLVECPVCGSGKVEKAIMAPRLGRADRRGTADEAPVVVPAAPAEGAPVAMMSPAERELGRKLKELRDHITRNADYVGKRFPEEARRMHYGETEHRSIYGEASAEDADALVEEGIEFHHLPRLPDEWN
ncbi:MAG: DUF1178 family protein [Xanthobacteraceae bacterium]